MGANWKVVAVGCAVLVGLACSSTDPTPQGSRSVPRMDPETTEMQNPDCPPPPEETDGGLSATFETTCEGDPVWRFAVANTGDVTIHNIAIIPEFNLPDPTVVPKLCPAGDGGCTFVAVAADAIHQHAECEFDLEPGDDFACSITLQETSLISLMLGQTDDGRQIELNSNVTCEPVEAP